MNNAITFDKSFLPPQFSVLNSSYWDTVLHNYENGKHKDTIHAVLDYIRPGLSDKATDANKSKFSLPHGSIRLNLEITDTSYLIDAPFLKIPARSLVPLMRQAAEINFSTLVLSQIVLEGDEIYFRFNAPLELCEPYKLYRVMEEICIQADANDDLFIDKFGAQRFAQMEIVPFSPEQTDLAWDKFQAYLQEGLDYVAYFESKRIEYFAWDALYLTLLRIDYFMRPQGLLKTEIDKAVKDLNSSDPPKERVAKVKKTVQKLQTYDKQKFVESMYQSQEFISEKPKYEMTGVGDYLNKNHNTAREERQKKDFIGSTLSMLSGIYGMLYYCNIPQAALEIVEEGLKNASGKPWSEASDALWGAFEQLMNPTAASNGRGASTPPPAV